MAEGYFDRLRGVRSEYEATREALAFLAQNWGSGTLTLVRSIAHRDIKRALDNLELTYFLRLHAEFESLLREDLQQNGGNTSDEPKIRVLVSRAVKARRKQRKTMDPDLTLFSGLERVHKHRNRIAHGDSSPTPVRFDEALSAFNTFLARLTLP